MLLVVFALTSFSYSEQAAHHTLLPAIPAETLCCLLGSPAAFFDFLGGNIAFLKSVYCILIDGVISGIGRFLVVRLFNEAVHIPVFFYIVGF